VLKIAAAGTFGVAAAPWIGAAAMAGTTSAPLRAAPPTGITYGTPITIENAAYRLTFRTATWAGGKTVVRDLWCTAGGQWQPLITTEAERLGEQWVVCTHGTPNRTDYYSSTVPKWVTWDTLASVDAKTVRLTANLPDGSQLRVDWSVAGLHPRATVTLTPAASINYMVGHQAFTGLAASAVTEVLCGPRQHARVVETVESLGALDLPVPASLVEHQVGSTTWTWGVAIPADQVVFESEHNDGIDGQRYGMSLRNESDEVQPIFFAPQFGTRSRMTAGTPYSFTFQLRAQPVGLYEAYKQLAQDEYGLTNYRANVYGTSLTATLHNLIDLVKDGPATTDPVTFTPSYSGWWDRAKSFADIENDKATRQATAGALLSAYYLTADDTLYGSHALPVVEFHVSRDRYSWMPDAHRICGIPFDTSTLVPLHRMMRGMSGGIEWAATQHLNGARDSAFRRPPMATPVNAYRLTGDPAHLATAKTRANDYISTQGILTGYDTTVDAADFQYYFSKAWIELLDLYEESGEQRFLDAAYREAQRFVTQHYVRPIEHGTTTVPAGTWVTETGVRWAADSDVLPDYPGPNPPPPESADNWKLNVTGLTFEAVPTYRPITGGHTLLPMWAPFLLRLSRYVNDPLLADIAANAVIGRYTNYPGYYLHQFSVTHMKPDFPTQGPTGATRIFFHHIPAVLGLTIDYLLTEQWLASGGRIEFPAEFEATYAFFRYHTYGHRPGQFFDVANAWLWMPRGLVTVNNYVVNWIGARAGNTQYAVGLTNTSATAATVTVTLDAAKLNMTASTYPAKVYAADGTSTTAVVTNNAITVTVPGKGLVGIVVSGLNLAGLDVNALHTEPSATPSHPTAKDYDIRTVTGVGKVRGMLLVKPDRRRYHAYVQVDSDVPATLHYRVGTGAWQSSPQTVSPYEWTVSVAGLDNGFSYYVEVPSTGTTSPQVDLACRYRS
jgi:hypothetical protein